MHEGIAKVKADAEAEAKLTESITSGAMMLHRTSKLSCWPISFIVFTAQRMKRMSHTEHIGSWTNKQSANSHE